MSDSKKHLTTDERFAALEASISESAAKLTSIESENATLKAAHETLTNDLKAATDLNTEMEGKISELAKSSPADPATPAPAAESEATIELAAAAGLSVEDIKAAVQDALAPIEAKVDGFDDKFAALQEGANKGTLEANLTKQAGGEESIVEPDASTDGAGNESPKLSYEECFEADKSVNPQGMSYAAAESGTDDGIYLLTRMQAVHGTPDEYTKKQGIA